MGWNYYSDLRQMYLAFKLKFDKGRGYGIYNTKKIEKEPKGDQKLFEWMRKRLRGKTC